MLPFVVTGRADVVHRSDAMPDNQTTGFSPLLARRTDRPPAFLFACLIQHEESMPESVGNRQLDRQDVGHLGTEIMMRKPTDACGNVAVHDSDGILGQITSKNH